MSFSWYALRTKPHKERYVWIQIQQKGLEAFYPHVAVEPVNPRARREKPYFPGYMFVRADLEIDGLNQFQYLPHAIGLVCFGGDPGVVPDNLVASLRSHLREAGRRAQAKPASGYERGDAVLIHSGQLAGYKAIFDLRLSGDDRVRVLLDLIGGRFVPVELNARDIRSNKPSLAI
jgi:transcription antitermination factor NusG